MRQGRSPDDDFKAEHPLYYRIESADELDGNYLDPDKIRTAFNVSVNWSKYSKPWDVIFDNPPAGIGSVLVRQVSVDLPHDRTPDHAHQVVKPHLYRLRHDPFDENYSHSLIAVIKDGQPVTKSKQVGELAKREFRQLLSDKCVILLRPAG